MKRVRRVFFRTIHAILLFAICLISTSALYPHDKEKLQLKVTGMHCTSCASMVRKTVRKVRGVESVTVDLDHGAIAVECDSASARRGEIIESIRRMGYTVTDSLETSPVIH
jgi:Cu+-exporting ATPase